MRDEVKTLLLVESVILEFKLGYELTEIDRDLIDELELWQVSELFEDRDDCESEMSEDRDFVFCDPKATDIASVMA